MGEASGLVTSKDSTHGETYVLSEKGTRDLGVSFLWFISTSPAAEESEMG